VVTDTQELDVLNIVLSHTAGNLYWKNAEGFYLGCNNAFAKIAGLSCPEEIIGKTDSDLFLDTLGEDGIEKLRAIDNLVMSSGKKITTEETGINEQGEIAYYLSKKIPLKSKSTQIIGIIGTSIDISEQKKLAQLKEDFIENAMHDIRTPFVGVLGMAELLWHQEENIVKKKQLRDLMESAKKLLDYNNEILDFSKNVAIDNSFKIKFNYKQIIDEIIKINTPAVKMKNIELSAEFFSNNDFFIGNVSAFKRILINLIGNAIKFTESGYIKIIVLIEKKNNNQVMMKLSVKDSGIGIPKNKKEMIFDKFVRLSASCSSLYSGLGLGLAIVKKLVEAMQGTIEVESEIGKGSTFTCILPLDIDIAEDVSQTIKDKNQFHLTPVKLLNLLLVEDDKICQLVASQYAASLGFNVITANCGSEALELSQKNNYDLILMDIGLPDIGGNDVTVVIRQNEKMKKVSPSSVIIGLTAHASEEIKSKCTASGIDKIITKPLTYSKMLEIAESFR
jgi:PAS domain S-box-containing protein